MLSLASERVVQDAVYVETMLHNVFTILNDLLDHVWDDFDSHDIDIQNSHLSADEDMLFDELRFIAKVNDRILKDAEKVQEGLEHRA